MKKSLFLITLVLSGSVLFPLKNTVAQTLYRPQHTIPGVSGNCLNYMILETGEFACLSYSQPVTTVPTTTTVPETPTTDQPMEPQAEPFQGDTDQINPNLSIYENSPPPNNTPTPPPSNTPVGENLLR